MFHIFTAASPRKFLSGGKCGYNFLPKKLEKILFYAIFNQFWMLALHHHPAETAFFVVLEVHFIMNQNRLQISALHLSEVNEEDNKM